MVAQNPGLANPEVSKIIGEQWRALPSETKEEWKSLAEVMLPEKEVSRTLTNVQHHRQRRLVTSSNTQIIDTSLADSDEMDILEP